jgi:hypothetical protein
VVVIGAVVASGAGLVIRGNVTTGIGVGVAAVASVSVAGQTYVAITGAVVDGVGIAGNVTTGNGVGVATGAGGEPVHPARLTTPRSRIVNRTAQFDRIVPHISA